MHGTVLWFNEVKNHGFIVTDEGERLYVHGSAFPGGNGIAGGSRGLEVSFEVATNETGRHAAEVSLTPYVAPRRARRRRSG